MLDLKKCQLVIFKQVKHLGGDNFPSGDVKVAFTKLNKVFLKWNVYTILIIKIPHESSFLIEFWFFIQHLYEICFLNLLPFPKTLSSGFYSIFYSA